MCNHCTFASPLFVHRYLIDWKSDGDSYFTIDATEGVKLIETRISSRGAFGRHQCQDNKHAIRGKKHVNRKGRGLSSGEFLDLEFSYMSPSKLGREEWLWAQKKDNIYSIVTF